MSNHEATLMEQLDAYSMFCYDNEIAMDEEFYFSSCTKEAFDEFKKVEPAALPTPASQDQLASSENVSCEEYSLVSSNGETSIFKSTLKKPSRLHFPSIDPLHGGLTPNEPSSDSFNFDIDFDPSSFDDHILATSGDLSIVDS